MTKPNLEKFKFATLKNVKIEVEELENKIEVRIEPVSTEEVKADFKEIEIYYKPLDHYERGDFLLEDNHKKIRISKSYCVPGFDGDVDWDFKSVYPCEQCERERNHHNREYTKAEALTKENEELKNLIITLAKNSLEKRV